MFYIRKAILSSSNYQLDRCFPEIFDTSHGDKFADLAGPDEFTQLPSETSDGSSTFSLGTWSFGKEIPA